MKAKAGPNYQGNNCCYSQKWRKCQTQNSMGIRDNLTVCENTKIPVVTGVHDVTVTLVHETNGGFKGRGGGWPGFWGAADFCGQKIKK